MRKRSSHLPGPARRWANVILKLRLNDSRWKLRLPRRWVSLWVSIHWTNVKYQWETIFFSFHTGLFIFCWLPFFTLYLLNPFCDNCINPILFSIAFWIGYLNSAINPIIYGALSKDFRFAFKRIICKFFCSGEGLRQPSSRRGSDMSAFRHNAGTRTPSISPSALAQSICEDSDPIQDTTEPVRWRSFAPSSSSGTGGRSNINVNSNNSSFNSNSNINNTTANSNLRNNTSVYDICHPLVMESPKLNLPTNQTNAR